MRLDSTQRRGSSPHARGARSRDTRQECSRRDHPRMRGEHVRGLVHRQHRPGIIPACAGSTYGLAWRVLDAQGSSPHARGARPGERRHLHRHGDHPRMRGEHAHENVRTAVDPGIIPACAGSTVSAKMKIGKTQGSSPHARGARPPGGTDGVTARDHPRMRGEHQTSTSKSLNPLRIIPACAGSTQNFMIAVEKAPGSSPHARGALITLLPSFVDAGDHPRMRGEHR